MPEEEKRLNPTPSTIKKLFAYSGNQCADPTCSNMLVDETGTMIGKVAHISAASPKGPRYNPTMTDEQRRNFNNLLVLCGPCHDVIDDKANEDKYPVESLKNYKRYHEDRFRKAERQLIEQSVDTTQMTKPTYPKTLAGLAKALDDSTIGTVPEDIEHVTEFIDKLKELPLRQRDFAIKVSERMLRNKVEELPTEDVEETFPWTRNEIKKHLKLLEFHQIGGVYEVEEGFGFHIYIKTKHGFQNPFFEILKFCEASGSHTDEFLFDLNFSLYDEVNW